MWNVGGSDAGVSGKIWTAASNPAQVEPNWIGNTVFNEMTPILVLRNPAGTAKKVTMLSLSLFITNTPGGPVHFKVINDRIDRYVTLSGTLHGNGISDSVLILPETVGRPALSSSLQIYDEIPDYEASSFTNTMTRGDTIAGTVAVAGSPGDNDYGMLPATAGNSGVFNFAGSLVIEPNTTVAIYAWAITTAPQGRFAARWAEENMIVR